LPEWRFGEGSGIRAIIVLIFFENDNEDEVTSVIAWIAVDERRPTGLYFASDSRRSWEGRSDTRDDCVKLFVAKGTREIFAFAGDATFPPRVLEKICQELESNPQLVTGFDGPYERSAWVYSRVRDEFNALVTKPQYAFTILHGTRNGAMQVASFHLFEYTYHVASGTLASGVLDMNGEAESSVMLNVIGTGHAVVKSFVEKATLKLGDVSRAHFSAFCSAVESGQDEWSGGPIQLVGVHSIKDSLHYGVFGPNGRYYRGSTHLPANHAEIRWRNWQLEKVDSLGNVSKSAR
jgi:hypothetical protein